MQREGGSASARAANGELFRSGNGHEGPSSARGVGGEGGDYHRSQYSLYGSGRNVTAGGAGGDAAERDPDVLEAGLRESGERFALIFSQLDKLSLNSGLGVRDKTSPSPSLLNSALEQPTASASAGEGGEMGNLSSTPRVQALPSEAASVSSQSVEGGGGGGATQQAEVKASLA